MGTNILTPKENFSILDYLVINWGGGIFVIYPSLVFKTIFYYKSFLQSTEGVYRHLFPHKECLFELIEFNRPTSWSFISVFPQG